MILTTLAHQLPTKKCKYLLSVNPCTVFPILFPACCRSLLFSVPDAKVLELQEDSASASKATPAPAKSASVLRRLSSFFAPLVSTISERSLQTESATVCGSLSQAASADHRPDDDSAPSGTHSSKLNLAHRIFNRLTKLPDISEAPSGVEPPVPTNKLATPANLTAYFTGREEPQDEYSLFGRRGDTELPNSRPLSPPRCVANIPQYSNMSPFPGPEFYDDVASGNIHPKPTADSLEVSCLDRNSSTNGANETAAGQILGGAIHRSARVGIA